MRGSTLIRSLRPLISRGQIRYATSNMRMPAMSPTMTEGGIAGWRKAEGDSFSAGDVLLEIETDKATIDVEAQDDGVLGKILVKDGSSKIPVGQIIAVLAEEGDDLSSIEIPSNLAPEGEASSSSSASSEKKSEPKKEESSPAVAPASPLKEEKKSHGHKVIKHSKPLFPSVSRLLQESDLTSEQISKLKGTGKNGMLTKGDVLVALGKIKSPYGSAEKITTDHLGASGKRASESKATTPATAAEPAAKKETPITATDLRRLIVEGLSKASAPKAPIIPHTPSPLPLSSDALFDEILAPYASLLPPPQPHVNIPEAAILAEIESKGSASGSLSGGKKDDYFAGLF